MDEFIQFAQTFGVPMALVVGLLVRDWLREKALTSRVQQIEDFQRDKLVGLVESITSVATQCKEALQANTAALNRVNGALRDEFREERRRGG